MIPIDYVSRREAVGILTADKFAGVPDRPTVITAKQAGIDAADGSANDEAIADIWPAVDQGKLDVFAHGPGNSFLRMSAEDTKQVPLLRAPRGGDFTFLRPESPYHAIVVSQFGSRTSLVRLAFRKDQVEKVARLARRRKRRTLTIIAANQALGRPSRRDLLRPIVRKLIEDGRWNPTMSLITLAKEVERSRKWGDKVPSEDTVTRVLNEIYDEKKDRRFQRVRRTMRSSKR